MDSTEGPNVKAPGGANIPLGPFFSTPQKLSFPFVVQVNSFDDFGTAIESKIIREVTGEVPEPTTMILLGSGLLGLWGARKKFRK